MFEFNVYDIIISECGLNEYWSGYGCLQKKVNSDNCPLNSGSPPAIGFPTCRDGGGNFWYINIGGHETDWNTGTDAMCLSTNFRPVAWGVEDCQYATSEAGCNDLLANAGCLFYTGERYSCMSII